MPDKQVFISRLACKFHRTLPSQSDHSCPLAACLIQVESNKQVQLVQCEENNAPLVLNWFDQRLFRSLVGHDAELKCHRFSPLIVLELLGFGAAKPYWFQYQKISGALLKNPAVDILDQNPVLLQSGRTISASSMMNDAKSHPLKYLPLHAHHISMVLLGTVSSLRCCSRSWQSMAV